MRFRETVFGPEALRRIEALLPDSWNAEIAPHYEPLCSKPRAASKADGKLFLIAPNGEKIAFVFETKTSGISSRPLLAQLRELAHLTELPVLFLSDYIGPGLRSQLTSAGFSYADATGWVSLVSESPLVVLVGQGAAKSPRKRGSSAVTRLDGVAVNRVVRALTTTHTPIRVSDLADAAGVSPSSVSKLLPTLASEGIIDRDEQGRVSTVRRLALVQRWGQDYSYAGTNGSVGFFIAPRGLRRTLDRLNKISVPATLTGSAAARELLPAEATSVVPLRLLALYTDQPDVLVQELGLIPADQSTANVAIALPQATEVLDEPLAPAALVLADLLTLPGRGDAEAKQLADALYKGDKEQETR